MPVTQQEVDRDTFKPPGSLDLFEPPGFRPRPRGAGAERSRAGPPSGHRDLTGFGASGTGCDAKVGRCSLPVTQTRVGGVFHPAAWCSRGLGGGGRGLSSRGVESRGLGPATRLFHIPPLGAR